MILHTGNFQKRNKFKLNNKFGNFHIFLSFHLEKKKFIDSIK